MNACANCGATSPRGEAFCPKCGTALPVATKPPSAWRRVITAAIALLFLGLGALVVAYTATTESDDPQAAFGYVFGGELIFLGLPFAIAALVPFGGFRRILVGIGAALVGTTAIGSFAIGLGLGSPVALVAAGLAFYLGYRIAR